MSVFDSNAITGIAERNAGVYASIESASHEFSIWLKAFVEAYNRSDKKEQLQYYIRAHDGKGIDVSIYRSRKSLLSFNSPAELKKYPQLYPSKHFELNIHNEIFSKDANDPKHSQMADQYYQSILIKMLFELKELKFENVRAALVERAKTKENRWSDIIEPMIIRREKQLEQTSEHGGHDPAWSAYYKSTVFPFIESSQEQLIKLADAFNETAPPDGKHWLHVFWDSYAEDQINLNFVPRIWSKVFPLGLSTFSRLFFQNAISPPPAMVTQDNPSMPAWIRDASMFDMFYGRGSRSLQVNFSGLPTSSFTTEAGFTIIDMREVGTHNEVQAWCYSVQERGYCTAHDYSVIGSRVLNAGISAFFARAAHEGLVSKRQLAKMQVIMDRQAPAEEKVSRLRLVADNSGQPGI